MHWGSVGRFGRYRHRKNSIHLQNADQQTGWASVRMIGTARYVHLWIPNYSLKGENLRTRILTLLYLSVFINTSNNADKLSSDVSQSGAKVLEINKRDANTNCAGAAHGHDLVHNCSSSKHTRHQCHKNRKIDFCFWTTILDYIWSSIIYGDQQQHWWIELALDYKDKWWHCKQTWPGINEMSLL